MNAEELANKAMRASAQTLHKHAVSHGWAGPFYNKSYEELEETDPIGFDEFNAIACDVINSFIPFIYKAMYDKKPE